MTESELILAIQGKVASGPSAQRFEVATPGAVDAAEMLLGFSLPGLVKRLYLDAANGGFGPSHGVLGVEGGKTDIDDRTIISLYLALRQQDWPSGILPVCDLGCAVWACLDRREGLDDHGPLLMMNNGVLTRTDHSLSSWLEAWVADIDLTAELFEINYFTGTDPFTCRPMTYRSLGRTRGAVIEDFDSSR